MPQIIRVLRAKSVVGLAPASIYAEVVLFSTRIMYHALMSNPFRTYGESLAALVQTLMMVGLLWRYGAADDGDVLLSGDDSTAALTAMGTGRTTARRSKGWVVFVWFCCCCGCHCCCCCCYY